MVTDVDFDEKTDLVPSATWLGWRDGFFYRELFGGVPAPPGSVARAVLVTCAASLFGGLCDSGELQESDACEYGKAFIRAAVLS